MDKNCEGFYFYYLPELKLPVNTWVAYVVSYISSKEDLFHVLANVLNFPEYFGDNWDALEECIRDLSWIPSISVTLVHDELPTLPDKELQTYLVILQEAIRFYFEKNGKMLFVWFPKKSEYKVKSLLRIS